MDNKCEFCTEKCPQAEMAHNAALGRMYATKEFVSLLKKVESGELVEVVRCKDCDYCEEAFDDYWCNYNWNYAPKGKPKLTRADGFCHNGERKEG